MALAYGTTVTSLKRTATGTLDTIAHTTDTGTKHLVLAIYAEAQISLTIQPMWNTTEAFTLMQASTAGGSTDVRCYIYKLDNPSIGAYNVTFTSDSNDNSGAILRNITTQLELGTAGFSFLEEDVNDAATTTMVFASAGAAGLDGQVIGCGRGGDTDPVTNDQTFTPAGTETNLNTATGTATGADIGFYWLSKEDSGTTAVTVTQPVSDENVGMYFQWVEFAGGILTVTPDDFRMDNTSITIAGANFEASQGTGEVYLSDVSTLAGGANEVEITSITSWSDTEVVVSLASNFAALWTLGHLTTGYLIITNNSADEYSKVIRLARPIFVVAASGASTAVGTQGSVITGLTGTEVLGRIEKTAAQNPSTTTTNVGLDGNTQLGFMNEFVDGKIPVGATVEWLLYIGGVQITAHTNKPTVTVAAAASGTTVTLFAATFTFTPQTLAPANALSLTTPTLDWTSNSVQPASAVALTSPVFTFTPQTLALSNPNLFTLTAATFDWTANNVQLASAIPLTSATLEWTADTVQPAVTLSMSVATFDWTEQTIQAAGTVSLTAPTLDWTSSPLQLGFVMNFTAAQFDWTAHDITYTQGGAGTVVDLNLATLNFTAQAIQNAFAIGMASGNLSITPQTLAPTHGMSLTAPTFDWTSNSLQLDRTMELSLAELGLSSNNIALAHGLGITGATLTFTPAALQVGKTIDLTGATFTFQSDSIEVTFQGEPIFILTLASCGVGK